MAENENGATEQAQVLQFIKLWYLFGIAMLIGVGAISLMPIPDVGVSDKLSHLVTYFILGGWFGLLASNRIRLAITLGGLMFYGILLELLQGTTGYRFAEMADVLANGAGLLLGILLYFSPLRRLLILVDSRLALILQR